jgi:hypothetical protein
MVRPRPDPDAAPRPNRRHERALVMNWR